MSLRLGDSVSALPQCGKVKTERLNAVKVFTIHDLLNYQGLAPTGINLTQMRHLAKSLTGQEQKNTSTLPHPVSTQWSCPHTTNHNWYKLAGHMLGKTIARVMIDELLIAPYGVVLIVKWYNKQKWSHKPTTPLMLAATHVLWGTQCVVSDDSDNESEELPAYLLASTDLPTWEIQETEWNLSTPQQDQLRLAVQETRKYQRHAIVALLGQ